MYAFSSHWLSLFVLYHFLFLSQYSSPYPVVQTGGINPAPFPSGPLPCAYSSSGPPMSSPRFSPSPQHTSLPLTPHASFPSAPSLGTPQTPLSTPQHLPSVALHIPLLTMTMPHTVCQQQGGPPTSQANLGSFHTAHPLPRSQVQPIPYPAPHPEQELAEQPVQVNMRLGSHRNRKSIVIEWKCVHFVGVMHDKHAFRVERV